MCTSTTRRTKRRKTICKIIITNILIYIRTRTFKSNNRLFNRITPFSRFNMKRMIIFTRNTYFTLQRIFKINLPPIPRIRNNRRIKFFKFRFNINLINFFFFISKTTTQIFTYRMNYSKRSKKRSNFFINNRSSTTRTELSKRNYRFFTSIYWTRFTILIKNSYTRLNRFTSTFTGRKIFKKYCGKRIDSFARI